MFNDRYQLTKAVLNGIKTQTRRIITPQPTYDDNVGICWRGYAYGINFSGKEGDYNNFVTGTEYNKSCKRYRVGEIVAIAQSYKDIFSAFSQHPNPQLNISVKNPTDTAGWVNKMFVKPELMPHQIRIINVRIQRLQDISDEDCLAEGIERMPGGSSLKPYAFYDNNIKTSCGIEGNVLGWYRSYDSPREAYAALIDRVSGKGTWERNPYIWVYDFELVK